MCRTPENYKLKVQGNGFTGEINMGPNDGLFDYKDNFEIFLACYDENNIHIKTIKVRLFTRVKLPNRTYYIRACSYIVNPNLNLINVRSFSYANNVLYKNCYWHDTRTIAVNPCYGDNVVFEGNMYKNIAIESLRPVTKVFGDIEDSHWYMARVAMKNCTYEGEGGANGWVINEVHWFEFTGNKNISLGFTNEGLFGAYIANNQIPALKINKVCNNYSFPILIIINNVFNSLLLHLD